MTVTAVPDGPINDSNELLLKMRYGDRADAFGADKELGRALDVRNEDRHVIVLVEGTDQLRRAFARALQVDLPSFPIKQFTSHADAYAAMAGDLIGKTAAVVANVGLDGRGVGFMRLVHGATDDRDPAMARAVRVLTTSHPDYKPGGDNESDLAQAVRDRVLDGVVQKPVRPDHLRRIVRIAIQRRAGVFAEREAGAKENHLDDYLTKSIATVESWQLQLGSLRARSIDVEEVFAPMEEMLKLLSRLDKEREMSDEDARDLFHDLNNKLTAMMFLDFVLDDPAGLSGSELELVKSILIERTEMTDYSREVHNAYKHAKLWSEIKVPTVPDDYEPERLKIPKGLTVCVIDDDPTVHKRTLVDFRNAGATVVNVDGRTKEGFEGFMDGDDLGIDVFILDNRMPFAKGYELIDRIRQKHPNALIVAHTADAYDLERDPENPYTQAGVEIAAKMRWNAVSGIIRRHLPRVRGEVEAPDTTGE